VSPYKIIFCIRSVSN